MKKELFILAGLIAIFSFALVSTAQAGALTEASATVDTLYGGRVSNYAVSFKVASSAEVGAQVRLIFPSGFNLPSTIASSTITMSSTLAAAIVASSTVSGQEITLWLADGAVAVAADTIHFSGIPNIQSPYSGGSQTLEIQTRTLADELSDAASSTAISFVASPKTSTDTSPDKIAPTSLITTPGAPATIPAGQEYAIKGISNDAGTSYVQKVEVSIDGGATWVSAERDGDISYTGSYKWKYVWQNPTAGEYTVQARGTDAEGNRETAAAGVKVTVEGGAAAPTPTPAPVPETSTIQSLQLQVISLQQQVVALLQQLLQLLQARM